MNVNDDYIRAPDKIIRERLIGRNEEEEEDEADEEKRKRQLDGIDESIIWESIQLDKKIMKIYFAQIEKVYLLLEKEREEKEREEKERQEREKERQEKEKQEKEKEKQEKERDKILEPFIRRLKNMMLTSSSASVAKLLLLIIEQSSSSTSSSSLLSDDERMEVSQFLRHNYVIPVEQNRRPAISNEAYQYIITICNIERST